MNEKFQKMLDELTAKGYAPHKNHFPQDDDCSFEIYSPDGDVFTGETKANVIWDAYTHMQEREKLLGLQKLNTFTRDYGENAGLGFDPESQKFYACVFIDGFGLIEEHGDSLEEACHRWLSLHDERFAFAKDKAPALERKFSKEQLHTLENVVMTCAAEILKAHPGKGNLRVVDGIGYVDDGDATLTINIGDTDRAVAIVIRAHEIIVPKKDGGK